MRRILVIAATAAAWLSAAQTVQAKEVMLMNRIGPSKLWLYVANADGSGERQLLPASADREYDASFSPDGKWIVFTSERDGAGDGQADIWRVRPDGTGLERLTSDTSMEDAGALSPDGNSLAYVSTKGGARTANIWVLDLKTKRARNLTGDGKVEPHQTMNGYFRPSWSPDGKWIAFSSDREEKWQGAETGAGAGHAHPTSLYVMKADGTEMRRLTTTTDGNAFGTPKWSADGKKIAAYTLQVRQTFAARMHGFGIAALTSSSQIVEIDVASGAQKVLTSGLGLKTNPQYLPDGTLGYLIKATQNGGPEIGIAYSDGKRGSKGDVRSPSWSPDGKQVVYYRFESKNRPQNDLLYSWDKSREYRYSDVLQTVCPKSGRMALTALDFPFGNPTAPTLVMNVDGTNPVKIFQRQDAASLMPTWSPDCQWVAFGVGTFFGGRGFAPANVFMAKADGSEVKQVTNSRVNAGFPAWSLDGKSIIYRVWGTAESPETRGLREINLADNSVKTLTTEWDNFPFIAPVTGDRVVFTRRMPDFDFEVFTMKTDGSDVKRLTSTAGADAHATWTADGKEIWFESSRTGFKDEAAMFDISPQPYAQIFLMDRNGGNVRQLTDSKWEDSMGMYVNQR